MRKSLKIGFLSLATASLFSGCAMMNNNTNDAYTDPEFQGAPEWVLNPMMEGAMCALGSAQKNAGNDISFQRSEALADGKDALAMQISTKVSTLFKSFKATTGSGKDATFDKASSKVSKQLASQTLNGAKAYKAWRSRSGTMYLLVCIPNEPVKKGMEKAVKTSFKNDRALYQKFLAAKADGELDKELSKAYNQEQ